VAPPLRVVLAPAACADGGDGAGEKVEEEAAKKRLPSP